MASIMGGYTATQGYVDAYNKIGSLGATGEQSTKYLEDYGQQFANAFRNLVGRDPTSDESDVFYRQVVAPVGTFPGGQYAGQQELTDRTNALVANNFQRQAEDQAKVELQSQQSQANDLASLFRQQSGQTANTLESQLQDFVQRTYEKVRPNLITSMQQQGLLNSGATDVAFAGAFKDLANSAQDTLGQYKIAAEDQANAIAFGGASAPYELARGQAMNRPSFLQGIGQQAAMNNYNTRQQEINFHNNMAMQNQAARLQRQSQPSFLRTFGQNFGAGLGQSTGNSLGKWFSPNTGASAMSGGAA